MEEIKQAPEELLQALLAYLQVERMQRTPTRPAPPGKAAGPHAEYWNQFIGAFADEEWERPPQDPLETRPAW
jgi:hypothetical protein